MGYAYMCVQEDKNPPTPSVFFSPLPKVPFNNIFQLPEIYLRIEALDRYHEAVFNNDNLGKKSQDILSNNLLALDKKHKSRDFTERDFICCNKHPLPNQDANQDAPPPSHF